MPEAGLLSQAEHAAEFIEDKMRGKSRTVRVQIELPSRSHERLMALKARTESGSYAEVMRNALRLYEYLVGKAEQRASFYVKEPGMEQPEKVEIFVADDRPDA